MMRKYLITTSLIFLFCGMSFAGEVKVRHRIEKNSERNEYKITSVYSGVVNASFVKIRYKIPSGINIITPSSGSSVSKKESDGISFYSLSVNEIGIISTLFYLEPNNDVDEINLEISFVYASGEDKIKADIKNLIIDNQTEYTAYVGEAPKNETFEIKDFDSEKNTDNTEVSSTSTSASTSTSTAVSSNGIYSIQLLSLNDYSDERVMRFCLDHKINNGDIIKRNVNGISKVSIGRYTTKDEALAARLKMIAGDDKLADIFIVVLK